MSSLCNDPIVLSLWHPIAANEDIKRDVEHTTGLLGTSVHYRKSADDSVQVWTNRGDETVQRTDHPVTLAYGYVWTCLGTPDGPLFDLPEYAEPDRRNVCAASVGVHVSAPRAVENFLDMGHFPFVHTGILGAEPHTEVREYEVTVDEVRDEILATECVFYQPQAAAASSGGAMSDYIYRVPHPYCTTTA